MIFIRRAIVYVLEIKSFMYQVDRFLCQAPWLVDHPDSPWINTIFNLFSCLFGGPCLNVRALNGAESIAHSNHRR